MCSICLERAEARHALSAPQRASRQEKIKAQIQELEDLTAEVLNNNILVLLEPTGTSAQAEFPVKALLPLRQGSEIYTLTIFQLTLLSSQHYFLQPSDENRVTE